MSYFCSIMNETQLMAAELEELLKIQEDYFDNLIRLGLIYENSGDTEKAESTYKRGIDKAEYGLKVVSGTLAGLYE